VCVVCVAVCVAAFVAVCVNVCVAACVAVFKSSSDAVCTVSEGDAACVLQCVLHCVLQRVLQGSRALMTLCVNSRNVIQRVAVCGSALQCVVVCGRAYQGARRFHT